MVTDKTHQALIEERDRLRQYLTAEQEKYSSVRADLSSMSDRVEVLGKRVDSNSLETFVGETAPVEIVVADVVGIVRAATSTNMVLLLRGGHQVSIKDIPQNASKFDGRRQ